MEKIKWVILGILLLVLVVVIVRNPDVEEEVIQENHAKIQVSISDVLPEVMSAVKIEQGEYILYLDNFQVIEGRGKGWHIGFSRPVAEKEMILLFDVVDTSETIFTSGFPQEIWYSLFSESNTLPHKPLYRGSFRLGYKKRLTTTTFNEDLIPLLEFNCRIDTAWVSDSVGGMKMSFNATHSELLHKVYGMKYSVSGTFHIHNAPLTKRTIQ